VNTLGLGVELHYPLWEYRYSLFAGSWLGKCCRWLLKYIIYEILHHKERRGRKARAVKSFAVFAHFAVRYFFRSPSTPSRLHSAWVPVPVCSARLCDVGAGRRFSILPAGFGCEVEMDAWVGGGLRHGYINNKLDN